jgi:hypothetical protein
MPVDLVVSASIPLLTLWLYEASNWVALTGQGYSVSFTMVGLLPLGVAGASTGAILPITKVIQLALAIGPLILGAKLLSRARLRVSEALAISFIGVYVASSYWEMLSLLDVLPMIVHVCVYISGTGLFSVLLLRLVRSDYVRQVNLGPDSTLST